MASIFGGYVFWNFSKLKSNFLIKKYNIGNIFFVTYWVIFGYFFSSFQDLLSASLLTAYNIGWFLWDHGGGQFHELLISRNLLEIGLNGVNFWRLSFFLELFSHLKFDFLTKKYFIIFVNIVGYFYPLYFYFISLHNTRLKFPF